MSQTVNYYTDIIECKECGGDNEVEVISEYDVEQGETFNEIVVGQKCKDCGAYLKEF